MTPTWFIAPGITTDDISDPATFEDKVGVFKRAVLGWQLEIAELLANGWSDRPVWNDGGAVLMDAR